MHAYRLAAAAVVLLSAVLPATADPRPVLFPNPAYTVPGSLERFDMGDVNGDGKPDLAMLYRTQTEKTITVLYGQGGGAFAPGVQRSFGFEPVQLRVADLDGDGRAEVIRRDGGNQTSATVIMKPSAGSLADTYIVPGTSNSGCIEPADFDGDGDLDLIGSLFGYEFAVCLNPGNGAMGALTGVDLPELATGLQVRVVDINHDPYPDLITTNGGSLFNTHLGKPGGGFEHYRSVRVDELLYGYDFATADINGDGWLDLVLKTVDNLQIFHGDAVGQLVNVSTTAVQGRRVTVLDADQDGRIDIAHDLYVPSAVQRVRILRNQPNGTFIPFLSVPSDGSNQLMAFDADSDGRSDLLTGAQPFGSAFGVGILLNGPDHLFGQRVLGAPPGGPVFVRDLNGDGTGDLLAAGDVISFFPGIAASGFGPQQTFPGASPDPSAPRPGRRAALFDSNGDGHLDVAMTSESFTNVSLGAGNGSFGPVSTQSGGERHDGIVAFDLGADGDDDVALACLQSGCILEAVGGGFGYYRVPVPSGYKNMVGGDLDGDGRFDLVGTVDGRFPLFESNSGQPQTLRVMLGQPGGAFVNGDEIPLPPWKGLPVRLALGDLNADGRLDVIFYAAGAGLGILLGTGGGHLAAPVILLTAGGAGMALWGDLLASDLDADGHTDIALLERFGSSDLLEVFLGDGTGGFPRRQAYVGLDVTDRFDDPRLAVGEFDRDGFPDLALASGTGAVSLLLSDRPSVIPHAPAASAGPDQFVECTSPAGALASLDGRGSSDPDSTPGTNDDIVDYEWTALEGSQQVVLGSGPQISAALGMGSHLVTLTVTDAGGLTSADDIVVTVRDTTPPVITATTAEAMLWPPNHRMVPVSVVASAADLCGPATGLQLQALSSNEPDDAFGDQDGRTASDIQEASTGTLDVDFLLRAERNGNEEAPGRIYTATYQASDASGNVATKPLGFSVPHDLAGVTEPLTIRVVETPLGTRISWGQVPGAVAYNVVRGDLAALRSLPPGGAQAVCVASEIAGLDTSGFEFADNPGPGAIYYVLVEYDDGRPSGYGTESAPYDRAPVAPSGACP